MHSFTHFIGVVTSNVRYCDLYSNYAFRLHRGRTHNKVTVQEAGVRQPVAERVEWNAWTLEISICTTLHRVVDHRRNLNKKHDGIC